MQKTIIFTNIRIIKTDRQIINAESSGGWGMSFNLEYI